MTTRIISDKYGNARRVSDKDNSINMVPNMSESNKKNISNRPSGIDTIMSASIKSRFVAERELKETGTVKDTGAEKQADTTKEKVVTTEDTVKEDVMAIEDTVKEDVMAIEDTVKEDVVNTQE